MRPLRPSADSSCAHLCSRLPVKPIDILTKPGLMPAARSYRVVDRDGWFAAGWARLASDGLVGKARKDGEVACEHIEVYLETQAPRDGRPLESLDDVLEARGHSAVDWAGYLAIRERENVVAQTRGLEDFRFESNEDMLALCK